MYIDWESVILKGFIGLIVFALLALLVGVPIMLASERKAKESFMAECLDDGKKQYECTAMWRAGESNTAAMPMPVIIR